MNKLLTEYIENSTDTLVELETLLTSIPALSPESGGVGELEKCEALTEWLAKNGITNLERFDAPDTRAKGGVRPNLIATIKGGTEENLWIISHIDVVPPGELRLWESDPWKVQKKESGQRGVYLVGRGVEDDQGGLVSSVIAALAFIKNNIVPKKTLKLLFAADEENGSVYGADYLLKEHADLFNEKTDMILIPDSGDAKGSTIEIAEKNILWMKFTVTGKQAHGSRPDNGVNACLFGAELISVLHKQLRKEFMKSDHLFEPPYSTFEPTRHDHNVDNVNTIPGEDVFYFDMRILPQYSNKEILEKIQMICSSFLHHIKQDVQIKTEILQAKESKATSEDSPLVRALSEKIQTILNVPPKTIGIGGGTVAAGFREIGIDCAVWSVTDENAHAPNEYIRIKSLVDTALVMAAMAE